jgi:hypothetical protein
MTVTFRLDSRTGVAPGKDSCYPRPRRLKERRWAPHVFAAPSCGFRWGHIVLLLAKFFAGGKEKSRPFAEFYPEPLRFAQGRSQRRGERAQGDMSCRAEHSEAKNLLLVRPCRAVN